MHIKMNTITAPQSTTPANRRRVWKWVAGSVGALVLALLVAFGLMFWRMSYIPADLDLATTRLSNQGAYRVSYAPRSAPITINQLHTWTIHVATADGQPVTDVVISVDGDMPQHGGSRTQYAHVIAQQYRAEYQALFGRLPDLANTARFPASAGPVADPAVRAAWETMQATDRESITRIYANIGKAIAAYERKIVPGSAPFDRYVEALLHNNTAAMRNAMRPEAVDGLRLFVGKAQCINCHNGPLFANNDFHNTGVPAAPKLPEDAGRAQGIRQC